MNLPASKRHISLPQTTFNPVLDPPRVLELHTKSRCSVIMERTQSILLLIKKIEAHEIHPLETSQGWSCKNSKVLPLELSSPPPTTRTLIGNPLLSLRLIAILVTRFSRSFSAKGILSFAFIEEGISSAPPSMHFQSTT